MKQFISIFKFEFRGQIRNKVSLFITIAIAVVIALLLSFPRFEAFLEKNDVDLNLGGDEETTAIGLYNASELDDAALFSAFSASFNKDSGYELTEISEEDSGDIKESVKSGDYDSVIVVESPTSIQYIADTVGLYNSESSIAQNILRTLNRYKLLEEKGLSEDEITEILTADVNIEIVVTGKDQTESFMYTYALIMVLYMVLLLYGQFVAGSVAEEKSTRAMEVLITSAKPLNLMFGKVLGAGCAGLLNLLVVLGTTVGFYQLNKDVVTNDIIKSLFGMPLSAAVYGVVFFVLGYFIYAFMFGAAGSLASRSEDLGALTMPINIIFIIAFMVSIFGMTGGSVDGTFFKVCSYLPTFAPMVMLVRVCMGSVSAWEVVLSIGIQLLTIGVLGVLCARIYRAGVLLYGNTPKLKDIFKILKEANN